MHEAMSPRYSIHLASLLLIALALAVAAVPAQAQTLICGGTVKEARLWTKGNWEGAVGLTLEGTFGSATWILCNQNEGRTTSKNGLELYGVNEEYGETCQGVHTTLLTALTTGSWVTITFSSSDPSFASCDLVPEWGGVVRGGTEDDGGRFGAWDEFTSIVVSAP